jgi:hypothetical protein
MRLELRRGIYDVKRAMEGREAGGAIDHARPDRRVDFRVCSNM